MLEVGQVHGFSVLFLLLLLLLSFFFFSFLVENVVVRTCEMSV